MSAEANPQSYHTNNTRPQREPREREIDFSPIGGIVPIALLAGVAYLGYQYKDKLLEILKNLEDNIQGGIKDLPPITLPGLGSDNDNPVGGQSAPSAGTTLGGVTSNTQWYKANGPTAAMPSSRCSTAKCGTSSGGNSGGNRWENEVKGWMANGFEVVVYFQIPSGAICKGGHVGLKHGGGHHTSPCEYSTGGACCCWWDTGIDNDTGKSYVEIERPHPHNLNRKYYASVGRIDTGKPFGVRWHISKEGAGIRLMQWVDTSGSAGAFQWKETYNVLDTGQFMPADYFKNHLPNLLNIEIRISDVVCKDVKMLLGPTSRQITSSAAYAQAYPAVLDEMRPLYNPRISMS